MATAVDERTYENLRRWLKKLVVAQEDGYWARIEEKYQALLGFMSELGKDAAALGELESRLAAALGDPRVQTVLAAVDELTLSLLTSDEIAGLNTNDSGALAPYLQRASQLAEYMIELIPRVQNFYGSDGTAVDQGLKLRRRIDELLVHSHDADNPVPEIVILYLFSCAIARVTPRHLHAVAAGNTNQVPFHWGFIRASAEAVFQLFTPRVSHVHDQRKKSEKFGILDSPSLKNDDLDRGAGLFGAGFVYFDVDGFKALNTKYSETAIDKSVLPKYQGLVAAAAANLGFAYAEGGDEVTVLLPNATEKMTLVFAEALREAICGQALSIGGDQITLTVSVGVAHSFSYPDLQTLPAHANLAMRAAKAGGRNCVFVAGASGAKRFDA